jgi:hypothetical protein
MFEVHTPNNVGIINDVTRNSTDNNLDLDNIFHANNINVGAVDPNLGDVFASIVSPVLSGNSDISTQISNIVKTAQETGSLPQDEMLKLQMASGLMSQNVTITSKVVNLGIKFVNELTHLQ